MGTKLMILKIPMLSRNWEFDSPVEGTALPVSKTSSSVGKTTQTKFGFSKNIGIKISF